MTFLQWTAPLILGIAFGFIDVFWRRPTRAHNWKAVFYNARFLFGGFLLVNALPVLFMPVFPSDYGWGRLAALLAAQFGLMYLAHWMIRDVYLFTRPLQVEPPEQV